MYLTQGLREIFVVLFELVVLFVQDSCHRVGVFWEKTQVQLGIAILHHAPQQACCVDAPLGVVDVTAVTPHAANMAFIAFVFSDQLLAHREIGVFEQGVLLAKRQIAKTQ